MRKTVVAVVGSGGFIARQIIPYLVQNGYHVIQIGLPNEGADYSLDLREPGPFPWDVLKGVDVILFLAAISSPDLCEREYDLCWEINVEGTGVFIQKAISLGCHVVFFSSDSVFGPDKGNCFTEKTTPAPNTAYGNMKRAVEERFCVQSNFVVVRLSYVFAKGDKYTQYLLSCLGRREKAEIFHPFYRNVIPIILLKQAILQIIRDFASLPSQVIHLVGPQLISRLQIADAVFRVLGTSPDYEVIALPEVFSQARPAITETCSLHLPAILPDYGKYSFEDYVRFEFKGGFADA